MKCLDDERANNAVDIQVAHDEIARLKEESRLKDELLLEIQDEAEAYKIGLEEKSRVAESLQEEVKAKTAQVKQYKKQIDGFQQGHSTSQRQQRVTPQHKQPQTQEDSQKIEEVCAP